MQQDEDESVKDLLLSMKKQSELQFQSFMNKQEAQAAAWQDTVANSTKRFAGQVRVVGDQVVELKDIVQKNDKRMMDVETAIVSLQEIQAKIIAGDSMGGCVTSSSDASSVVIAEAPEIDPVLVQDPKFLGSTMLRSSNPRRTRDILSHRGQESVTGCLIANAARALWAILDGTLLRLSLKPRPGLCLRQLVLQKVRS